MTAEIARQAAEEIVAILDRLDKAGVSIAGVDDLDKRDKYVILGDPDKPGHVQIRRNGCGNWIWDDECCYWGADDPKPETFREWSVSWSRSAAWRTEYFSDEELAKERLAEINQPDAYMECRDVTAQPWRRLVTGHGEDS